MGVRKGHIPWNKGRKGRQRNHSVSGLKPGWNKGLKMPKIEGDKNYQWKGDDASYRVKHRWIVKMMGLAKKCDECGKEKTTLKSIQWSNIDHKYRRNLEDWRPLCASCHRLIDNKKFRNGEKY